LISPRLGPPAFACARTSRDADPLDDVDEAKMNHGAFVDACQGQPDGVLTRTMKVPPDRAMGSDGPAKSNVHGAPSCRNSSRSPLIVTAAVRCCRSVFARAATETVAEPCPDGGLTLSHGASVIAFHWHSRAASTLTDPVPPL
jgi:hypothetical protein